jgi:hypothetical protein
MNYGEPWVVDGPFGPPYGGGPSVTLHHLDAPEPIAVTVSRIISLKHWSYVMSVNHYTAMLVEACYLWPCPIGLRFEDASVQTDDEEEIVDFFYSLRSSSADLVQAYEAAESLLIMIDNMTRPALEASGRTLSERESRYL